MYQAQETVQATHILCKGVNEHLEDRSYTSEWHAIQIVNLTLNLLIGGAS